MSVEQNDVIDFVGIEKSTGKLVLSISDHLPWKDFEEDHIKILQKKIYAYLDYIGGEQINDTHPNIKKII